MVFRFLFSIMVGGLIYAYPAYASLKSISRRPVVDAELEHWLMYWSIVGTMLAYEHLAEWTISWIPFYSLFKTIFIVFLALSTHGAVYVYTSHLGPWISRNEPQLAALKTRLADWVNAQRQIAWNHLVSFISQQTGLNLNSNDAPPAIGPQSPAMNLFRAWGPTILTPFRPTTPGPSDGAPTSGEEEESSGSGNESPSDTATIRARRLKVEAELAALMEMEREASSRLGKVKSK